MALWAISRILRSKYYAKVNYTHLFKLIQMRPVPKMH